MADRLIATNEQRQEIANIAHDMNLACVRLSRRVKRAVSREEVQYELRLIHKGWEQLAEMVGQLKEG